VAQRSGLVKAVLSAHQVLGLKRFQCGKPTVPADCALSSTRNAAFSASDARLRIASHVGGNPVRLTILTGFGSFLALRRQQSRGGTRSRS
jgi:hypothetical protein